MNGYSRVTKTTTKTETTKLFKLKRYDLWKKLHKMKKRISSLIFSPDSTKTILISDEQYSNSNQYQREKSKF